jgi:hypothetical protein
VKAFACVAAGGVLLCAVSSHLAFINFRVLGLILVARGGIDLWTNVGKQQRARCKARLAAAVARSTTAFESLTADLARDDDARVPLADLLGRCGRGHG